MQRIFILVVICGALTACGGGGGSSSGNLGSANYVFFLSDNGSSKTLNAYDPTATSGNGLTTIPTTDLTFAGGTSYTGISANSIKSSVAGSQVLFVDNGQFESANSRKSDKLAISGHSNYSFAGIICTSALVKSYLLFTDSGPDKACGIGGDDSGVQAVSTDMSASDPIIQLPSLPVAVLLDGSDTLFGLLLLDNGTLEFTKPTGELVKSLQQGITTAKVLGNNGTNLLLFVDGYIKIFNGTSKALIPLYQSIGSVSRAISDGTNFYFTDASLLNSAPVDGSGNATTLTTVSAGLSIIPQFIHNHYLVYTYYDGTSQDLRAVQLIPPYNKVTLVSSTTQILTYIGHSGDYVYYNFGTSLQGGTPDLSSMVAGAVKYDGSAMPKSIMDANWYGSNAGPRMHNGEGIVLTSLVLDQFTADPVTGKLTGGDISIYDAATNSKRNSQGSLPSGILSFSGYVYSGDYIYGDFDTATSHYFASIDTNSANSMKQIDTTTTAVTDSPIY